MQFNTQLLAGGIGLALAGCASKPPPPLTALVPASCTARIALQNALPLPLDASKQTVAMDASSACHLDESGRPASYLLLALPPNAERYEVTIDSAIGSNALFAFKVKVLNSLGEPLQVLPRERFTQRGAVLRASYLHAANESMARYLAIVADTDAVGQTDERLQAGINTTLLPAGSALFAYSSGTETRSTITKAYNGSLTLSAQRR